MVHARVSACWHIAVFEEQRPWAEGKATVFDDSFEVWPLDLHAVHANALPCGPRHAMSPSSAVGTPNDSWASHRVYICTLARGYTLQHEAWNAHPDTPRYVLHVHIWHPAIQPLAQVNHALFVMYVFLT